MVTNKRSIHIEWGHCDPAGIVYFPRYFEYFDACTNVLFESVGLPKPKLLEKFAIVGIPVVETRARFFLPSTFGDIVIVETHVSDWGASSFSVTHRLFNGEVLAVEAFEKRVWTVRQAGSNRLHSQPIPREVIDRFTAPRPG
jgi:4-hydroxybenzoyl-CoA thioesterase